MSASFRTTFPILSTAPLLPVVFWSSAIENMLQKPRGLDNVLSAQALFIDPVHPHPFLPSHGIYTLGLASHFFPMYTWVRQVPPAKKVSGYNLLKTVI